MRVVLLALLAAALPVPAAVAEPPTRARDYRLESGTAGGEELRRRFRPGHLELLEKLNRASASHLGRLKRHLLSWAPPMSSRLPSPLVVISHRLPVVAVGAPNGSWSLRPGSGGLVTALAPGREARGGLRVG